MSQILFVFCLIFSSVLFSAVSRIPIQSYPFLSRQRFIQFQLGKEQYLGLIDTGSAFSMLRKDVLEKIPKKSFVSNSEYIGITGEKYITSNFVVDEFKIGDFIAENIFKEEDENFWTEGSIIKNLSFIRSVKIYLMYQVFREGIIGMDLFQKFACVFDFPHSSIILANQIEEVIDENLYSIIPFEMGKAGVILNVHTDFGIKRLLLDSAATKSLIRLSLEERDQVNDECVTTKLTADGIDLGCWEFNFFDIAESFDDIDGILGIDFFKKSIIGLDFTAKVVYIQFPKLGSKERITYWLKSYFGK